MTNEQIAALIGAGNAEELLPLLWEKMRKLYRKMSSEYAAKYSERCRRCGVTVDDLRQESYFAMLDSIKAYNSRPPEQADLAFVSFCGYHFKNHAAALIGIRTKAQHSEPLNSYVVSLDAPVQNDSAGYLDETSLIELIPDTHSEDSFRTVESDDFSRAVREAVREELVNDPVGLQVIEQRYYDDKTLEQIGDDLDLSKERVRQIQAKVLRQLRKSRNIQEIAGRLNPYRHVGVETFRREGSIVEQLVERQDELERRCKINQYIQYFEMLSGTALEKNIELLSQLDEEVKANMREMVFALNIVAQRRRIAASSVDDGDG